MPAAMRAPALFLIAVLALLAGCAPAERQTARPPMWAVEDGDTRIVLLGAMHQLPPTVDWQIGKVAGEIRGADELWLEIAPDELAGVPARFAAMARDEPVGRLDVRIGRERAEAARDLASEAGIGEDDADVTESWALLLAIGNVVTADAGLSTPLGVEAGLTAAFVGAGKPVRGLESAQSQLTLFDALPAATQDRMLARAVAEAAQARPRALALVAAWAKGDTAAIAARVSAEFAATPDVAEPALYARNRAWAARLAVRMEQPGRAMVAVGVGHLVGEQALPGLMAARGFRVRRVQ